MYFKEFTFLRKNKRSSLSSQLLFSCRPDLTSAYLLCVFVHEKVLVSKPKLEEVYTEKQHFIIPGMS